MPPQKLYLLFLKGRVHNCCILQSVILHFNPGLAMYGILPWEKIPIAFAGCGGYSED